MTLGYLWATSPSRTVSRLSSSTALGAVAAPQYAIALILIVVVALNIPWFPTTGMHDPGREGDPFDLFRHIILPGIASGLVMLGVIARMFRSALLEVRSAPWVATMRARGLSAAAIRNHTVKNTMPTVLTVIGIQFGYLIGGVLFVEIIFSWPGLGLQLYNAITARDYPLVMGGVLLGAASFVVVNLFVDLLIAVIDPRTRRAG